MTTEKFNDDQSFDIYNSTTEGGLGTVINEETIDSIDLFDRDRGHTEQELRLKGGFRRKESYDINFYKEID